MHDIHYNIGAGCWGGAGRMTVGHGLSLCFLHIHVIVKMLSQIIKNAFIK